MSETAATLLNRLPTTDRRKMMLLFAAVLKIDLALASEYWSPTLEGRHVGSGNDDYPFERLRETANRLGHMADDNTGRADRELVQETWNGVKMLAIQEQDFEQAVFIRDRQDHINRRSATWLIDQVRMLCESGVGEIELMNPLEETTRLRAKARQQRPEYVCHLIRDIWNFERPAVAFNRQWRTSDSVGLARTFYEDRAFDRLPILADALIDAGCSDEQVLAHCRGPGPHVRGCWVVDRVLGRE